MNNSSIEINLDENIYKYIEKEKIKDFNIKKDIEYILKEALKSEEIYDIEVSVSIESVSKEDIRKINKEYRKTDKSTDVLSFPIFEKEEIDKIKKEQDSNKKIKLLELGDIFICLDIVKKQAIEFETGFKREVLYMITHGVCHLLGYDHEIEEDKIEMRKLEEKILKNIN